jgi:hypothetical protein
MMLSIACPSVAVLQLHQRENLIAFDLLLLLLPRNSLLRRKVQVNLI